MAYNRILCAATALRDALYVKMAECDAKPCKIFLSPTAATPVGVCCNCGDGDGQAWVSIVSAKPLYDKKSGFAPCAVETEVLFVVGIARCSPTIDDQGNLPESDELNAATERLARDFQLIRAAFNLFVAEEDIDNQMYRFGDWDNHPVAGGCQIMTHEIFVVLENCSPC